MVLTAVTVAAIPASGLWGSGAKLLDAVCLIGVSALVAFRRRRPVLVAVIVGVLLAIPSLTSDSSQAYNSVASLPALPAVFLYAYALGSQCAWPVSLVGLVPLTAGFALTAGTWNPLMEMVTVGPWLCGIVVASRRRTAEQLEVRTRELEDERELFGQQAVRYERARIARELHDIVAHCVSLMVVQANAGEQLARQDPGGAAEAFESISEAARQTDAEIDRLVELLATSSAPGSPAGLRIVDELARRARASGLRVSCQLVGDSDDLAEQSAETAYRVVQESITNAMKHAPGAPIEISVRGEIDAVHIEVRNPPATGRDAMLGAVGGGNGLAGMRERIGSCGGSLLAGPTTDRGWVVRARLPRHPDRRVAVVAP